MDDSAKLREENLKLKKENEELRQEIRIRTRLFSALFRKYYNLRKHTLHADTPPCFLVSFSHLSVSFIHSSASISTPTTEYSNCSR